MHLFNGTGRCAWDARRRAGEAMGLCARSGWSRVAVYGNGSHTEAVWDALLGSGVEPAVILDDAATGSDERFGVPVCRPEAVSAFAVSAVVLSANSIEDRLAERATGLGLPVVRLYGGVSPSLVCVAGSSARAG